MKNMPNQMGLRTMFPCCKGRAFFRATLEVPRERYDRKCRSCGQRYDIERRTLRESVTVRIDELSWTRVASVAVRVEQFTNGRGREIVAGGMERVLAIAQ